jgi:large subunit ribosomal protein L22
MAYKTNYQGYSKEHMARVVGTNLSVSTKDAIEICNTLRGKPIAQAKTILQQAIAKKAPIAFKRFTNGIGHRKGKIASGRYPVKACGFILTLVNSVESNAQQKGLNTSSLHIVHACAHKASTQYKPGRHRGRTMKNSHVELVVAEKEQKKKEKKIQKVEKKESPKIEVKKEEVKKEAVEVKKEVPAQPVEATKNVKQEDPKVEKQEEQEKPKQEEKAEGSQTQNPQEEKSEEVKA